MQKLAHSTVAKIRQESNARGASTYKVLAMTAIAPSPAWSRRPVYVAVEPCSEMW